MRMCVSDKRMIANVLAKLALSAEPTSKASGSQHAGKLEYSGFPGQDAYMYQPWVANRIASRE